MLTALLALSIHALSPAATTAKARELSARFVTNRVFVDATAQSGHRVEFYTDSGGGTNMICRSAAQRLGLAVKAINDPETERELGKNLGTTEFPAFKANEGVPIDSDGNAKLLVRDCAARHGWPANAEGDGFLSSRWFAGRIWTWNYPDGSLRIESANFHPTADAQAVPINFKSDSHGKRLRNFARIVIHVDGNAIDMLLDTGATTMLTPESKTAIADGMPALRATSFITHTQLEMWHGKHPDWRILEKAEVGTQARMIRVPTIEIGGTYVGPVWFTERPNSAFHEFMAQMMDKPTEGAIGGNALSHFEMTVDYPRATAYFRCLKGCEPTPLPAP